MLGEEKLTASCPGLGNIIGPLTFRGKDAPDYIPAKIAIVVTTAFACCTTALLMAYYTYENRRRDGLMSGVEHQENSEFLDLTDKENLEFRVSLLLALNSPFCSDPGNSIGHKSWGDRTFPTSKREVDWGLNIDWIVCVCLSWYI